METLQSTIAVIRPHQWMVSVADAYFYIQLVTAHHQFLRFSWQGTSYQVRIFLLVLSSAPWVFTKTLAALIAWLRLLGVQLYAYLNDLLIVVKVRSRGRPVNPKDYSGPHPSRICSEP